MNFRGISGIHCRDELIQLGNQRGTFVDWTIHESQPALKDMKCRAETIITVGAGDAMNLAVPVDVSDALQALPDDGFLVVDLFVVADVLPVAASFRFVVRTIGLLPVR